MILGHSLCPESRVASGKLLSIKFCHSAVFSNVISKKLCQFFRNKIACNKLTFSLALDVKLLWKWSIFSLFVKQIFQIWRNNILKKSSLSSLIPRLSSLMSSLMLHVGVLEPDLRPMNHWQGSGRDNQRICCFFGIHSVCLSV